MHDAMYNFVKEIWDDPDEISDELKMVGLAATTLHIHYDSINVKWRVGFDVRNLHTLANNPSTYEIDHIRSKGDLYFYLICPGLFEMVTGYIYTTTSILLRVWFSRRSTFIK